MNDKEFLLRINNNDFKCAMDLKNAYINNLGDFDYCTVDMHNYDYLDSAMLGTLLYIAIDLSKKTKGRLSLVNVSDVLNVKLDLIGMNEVINY